MLDVGPVHPRELGAEQEPFRHDIAYSGSKPEGETGMALPRRVFERVVGLETDQMPGADPALRPRLDVSRGAHPQRDQGGGGGERLIPRGAATAPGVIWRLAADHREERSTDGHAWGEVDGCATLNGRHREGIGVPGRRLERVGDATGDLELECGAQSSRGEKRQHRDHGSQTRRACIRSPPASSALSSTRIIECRPKQAGHTPWVEVCRLQVCATAAAQTIARANGAHRSGMSRAGSASVTARANRPLSSS